MTKTFVIGVTEISARIVYMFYVSYAIQQISSSCRVLRAKNQIIKALTPRLHAHAAHFETSR